MWNKESLRKVIRDNFDGYKFVIVANRESFVHEYDKNGKIVCKKTIGGVSTTFDTIMRATKGTWVAHGGGSADKETVDKYNRVMVPPGDPKYVLRRVWMTDEEVRGYYEGFSNETLWPLCHIAFVKPKFSERDWQIYKKINKRFAQAVLEEIENEKAVVWIQDYHFALLAKYIKEKRPDVLVAQFWHIPWPTYEIFRVCPWGKEILKGILHNDLVGFHRYYQVDNFLGDIVRELESKVDREEYSVEYKEKKTKVGAFPISVDYERLVKEAENVTKRDITKFITYPYKILAIGVDRVDYTKGIPNRLLAIERFLEKNPNYREKFVYLGIGSPSRTNISTYRSLGEQIVEEIERINKKFSVGNWQPIIYINRPIEHDDLIYLYKNADLCLVTPLDDGMNLVCKEYVATNKGDGALVLSSFIGAAKELTEAFLVNPYDIKGMADSIKEAIETPKEERIARMTKMKELIKDRNIYRWTAKFLLELAKLKK